MRAEIIAIGSELLLGDFIDSNTAWLSQRLAEMGVDVYTHVTIGDNPARLIDALGVASQRADIVLATGGLGPTQDDVTRECFAEFAGVPIVEDEELKADIAQYLVEHGYPVAPNNMRQATYPEGSIVLERIGTAPGIALQTPDAMLIAMPGVPREMKQMFTNSVIPIIRQLGGGQVVTVSRVINTMGIGESQISFMLDDLNDELEQTKAATLAFLASQGKVRVRLTTKAPTHEDAYAILDPLVERVRVILGSGVVGIDQTAGVQAVANALVAQGKTLAIAESITGGMLGAELTSIPGASQWFAGGTIVYTEPAKCALGGLTSEQLAAHGPVTIQTAIRLASQVRATLGTSIGLGVVGVAGPDEQDNQPVGTVMVALVGELPPMPGEHRSREVFEALDAEELAALTGGQGLAGQGAGGPGAGGQDASGQGAGGQGSPAQGAGETQVWVHQALVQNLGRTDVQQWAVNACIGQLAQALSEPSS